VLLLAFGLFLFLGSHSVRIFGETWRSQTIERIGPGAWKGIYSAISIAGLALMVVGYGAARTAPVELWPATTGARHLASLLTLVAFVLITAAYVPRNRIRSRLGHPMVLGVKLWAAAHLASNGTLADLLLFGSILVWAVLNFRAARRRDRESGASAVAPGTLAADAVVVVLGAALWWAFAFHLHARWIGVSPMG
jgi:uncharacterized membrane protein